MTNDIFKNIKNVSLSKKEKENIRTVLRAFIATHPVGVREGFFARLTSQKDQRSIFQQIYKTMPIVLLIALLLGGGAAAYADTSLPGDVLYPVKVNVNEEVRGWLAVSDDSEARLQVRLAERRLEEAEKLASEDRLNDDARAKIEANFEDHATRVNARIEAMEDDSRGSTNAVEVSSQFEASLKAHEEILNRLFEKKEGSDDDDSNNDDSDENISSIVARVRLASDNIDRVRGEAETRVALSSEADVKVSADRAERLAEEKIRDVEAYMEKTPSATVATYVEVREKLSLSKKLLESGKQYMDQGAYGKAFITFQESWNVAQKAWVVLTGSATVNVSVGSTGETGVAPSPQPAPMPVPKPGAEDSSQRIEAQKRIEQASNKISEVRRFLSVRMGVMTEEMAKKVEIQLVAAEKALGEAKSYFGLSAYSKAIVMARQSKELAELALSISTGGVIDPSVPPTSSGLVPIQKISPSGEIEIELEDADGSGKFR